MPQTAMLAPLPPRAVLLVFNYVLAVEAGDTEAAARFGGEDQELPALLVAVAERIVIPVVALPGPDEEAPCDKAFALTELGIVFLATLRDWREQSGQGAAHGIAQAIVHFTATILADDPEDVANTLEQMRAIALADAREAHPETGARL
jgi:hypothetical protein